MIEVELKKPNYAHIPSPIIVEILSRLPIKACLNCKLVCKEWYHIIISPDFANYRSKIASSITILLYGKLTNGRKNFLLVDLLKSSSHFDDKGNLIFSNDCVIKFKSKLNIPHYKLHVVNECNGLVCLKSSGQWSPYIICNLLTGQEVIIEQEYKASCSLGVFGLGQCRKSKQFKVVRVVKNSRSKKYVAEIQTLGTNEWRRVGDSPEFYLQRSGAFLHGSLHRISHRNGGVSAFDFEKEMFLDFGLPKCNNIPFFAEIGVIDSQLCISSLSSYQTEIWVMKEYGVKDSWVKQFVFRVESFGYRMPLLELEDGKLLVSYDYEEGARLGVCYIESGKCREVRVPGISCDKVMTCNARFYKF